MSIFSDNLRYLRENRKESQQLTAERLEIKRGRYEPWESGKSEPPYEMLIKISLHYKISIDLLLSIDVRRYKVDQLMKLDDNRIVLPIAVDKYGENLVEIVPYKARAGYLTGYADPEYIESLQQISLPFLGPGKFRGFPVVGDSMPPHEDGSIIVGKYIERLGDILDGKTYILITKDDGIVYKRLNKNKKNLLAVASDNSFYPPYEIPVSEILEVWEYECNIGRNDKKAEPEPGNIQEMFLDLKREIREIKKA